MKGPGQEARVLGAVMEGAFWLFLHEIGQHPRKADYIIVGKPEPVTWALELGSLSDFSRPLPFIDFPVIIWVSLLEEQGALRVHMKPIKAAASLSL